VNDYYFIILVREIRKLVKGHRDKHRPSRHIFLLEVYTNTELTKLQCDVKSVVEIKQNKIFKERVFSPKEMLIGLPGGRGVCDLRSDT
jgi:hypothetical protein